MEAVSSGSASDKSQEGVLFKTIFAKILHCISKKEWSDDMECEPMTTDA